ncbi:hypothetical protein QO239_22470 [Cupriavidus taiwanensis]|uniref:hypothetical protein n=1 Tax=Cupriavidus taiwanensis TaxID=164546 RepID=UPI002541E145|nr:hypothetical protein [Cupriavidus taiwanensis]MDK3025367.1 hypothetical protein [Cupriavidus taiwanensis]
MKLVKNRRLLDATLLAGAIIFASVVLWAHAQERHDLPPFDYEKSKQLSREKRAEYERDLFNELYAWNTGSPKYMGNDGTNRREADWMAMAQDGYELAYITLQVLQPSTGIRYSVDKPLARLTKLADGGDAGAMCLYTYLIDRDPAGKEAKYIKPGYAYKQRGAELGHPACLRDVSYYLMTGIHGYPKDVPAGITAAIGAERAGYGGARPIATYLAQQSAESDEEWTRLYCWQYLARRYTVYSDINTVISQLRDPFRRPPRPTYFALADELERWAPSLSECVALGMGDD